MGQHVKVQQLGPNTEGNFTLSLAEVEVFQFFNSGYANVALGKPATQSSTAFGGDASRATDGNTDGVYGRSNSVTHPMTPVFQVRSSSKSICCPTSASTRFP